MPSATPSHAGERGPVSVIYDVVKSCLLYTRDVGDLAAGQHSNLGCLVVGCRFALGGRGGQRELSLDIARVHDARLVKGISWGPTCDSGCHGSIAHAWGGTIVGYSMTGGALVVGLVLACAGCGTHGLVWPASHEASVGIRACVCLCAHHVVSVMLRVRLLVFPPNRRWRNRGAFFAMFPLALSEVSL